MLSDYVPYWMFSLFLLCASCGGGDGSENLEEAIDEGGENLEGGGVPDAGDNLGGDLVEEVDQHSPPDWEDVEGAEEGGDAPWSTTPLVVVTEILYNPLTIPDQVGEWFELANTGKVSVPLNMLVIITPSGVGSVTSDVTMLPGQTAVLARSEMPSASFEGLLPDGVVSKMLLPNEGGFVEVVLEGELLDRAQYQPGLGNPPVAGASLSLDPSAYDRYENNNPFAWCLSAAEYAPGEHGTPGVTNPPCPIPPVLGRTTGEEGGSNEEEGGEEEGGGTGGDGEGGWNPEGGEDSGDVSGLVISEIMFDPNAVSDAAGEWVEITNTSPGPVDLRGLILKDDANDFPFWGPEPLWVGPGHSVVIVASVDPSANGGIVNGFNFDNLGLNNGGDTVSLWDGLTMLDAVTYGPGFPPVSGQSLSLDPGAMDASANDDPSVWCPASSVYGAGDWGSPGWENAPCPEGGWLPTPSGDWDKLVITEIMYNPDQSKDPAGEWFEVLNTGSEPADINGLTLEEEAASHQIISGKPIWVGPGDYALLARSGSTSKNGGLPEPDYVYGSLALNNSGDLVLLRYGDTEIDRVEYSGGAGFPVLTGTSIQLSPLIWPTSSLNDSGVGWCASPAIFGAGDGGSPGEENPLCE